MFQEDRQEAIEIAREVFKEEISGTIRDIEKKIREDNQAGMKEAEIRVEKGMLAISEGLGKRIEKLEQEISALKAPAKSIKKEVK